MSESSQLAGWIKCVSVSTDDSSASVSANKSYNVFFNKIKTRDIQNLNPIRLFISSPGGFMDFGLFFNGAAATFDYRILENKSYNTKSNKSWN